MTTPTDLSDEQIERIRAAYKDVMVHGVEPEEAQSVAFELSHNINVLCDMALRVRALTELRRIMADEATLLRKQLKETFERATLAEARAEASAKDAANWKQLAEDYYAEHYHPEYMADGIQRGALDAHFSKLFDATKEQKRG